MWNLDNIFVEEHHIDKHEHTIESVTNSTKAQIAVVVTRSCIGIWNFITGKLKFKLANTQLGAIVTHAIVNEEGSYIISAESGDVLYWNVEERKVVFQEKQPNIQQMFYYKNYTCCLAVSQQGSKNNRTGRCVARSFPKGEKLLEFEYPYKEFKSIIMTSDEASIVCISERAYSPVAELRSFIWVCVVCS